MSIFIAFTIWSLLFLLSALFLWKRVGSRSKLYYLFAMNMVYLCGIFLIYHLLSTL